MPDSGRNGIFYCRYADDFAIGIIGSCADAEAIRREVTGFIQETLKLTSAEEKSHIRHSKKGMTFVGYEVRTYSGDRVIKRKRGNRHTTIKSISERIQLHIPLEKLHKFCRDKGYGNDGTTKAIHTLAWIWQTSLFKTLASKHKTSVKKIAKP